LLLVNGREDSFTSFFFVFEKDRHRRPSRGAWRVVMRLSSVMVRDCLVVSKKDGKGAFEFIFELN
jgi:hypothetical protein